MPAHTRTRAHRGGDAHNPRHEFLRLSPYHLIGDKVNGVLYRLLKTGLKDPVQSKQVQLIEFDARSLATSEDMDAVFVERMHAYVNNGSDTNDPYWHLIISALLKDKVGLRFVENNRRYYIFPTCVFVSTHDETLLDAPLQRSRRGGGAPGEAGEMNGRAAGDFEASYENAADGSVENYAERNRYRHTEKEADRLLDERRREDAQSLRVQTTVDFYGFGIHVNDGVGMEAVTAKMRGGRDGGRDACARTRKAHKARGGDDDQYTYYRYLKLSQTSHSFQTDLADLQELVAGPKLADTTDNVKRCESAAVMLRGQLEKLFLGGYATHVRVEIGSSDSSEGTLFNVKYDKAKHATTYDPAAHDKNHQRAYYQQHGRDARNTYDLDKLLKKQLHKEDIVRYLTERGDLAREKRIVLRYFNKKKRHHRYIIYTFPVRNSASKLAGNVVQMVNKSAQPDLGDPRIAIFKLEERSAEYWLSPDAHQASFGNGVRMPAAATAAIDADSFDPARIVPKLVVAIADEAESSETADDDTPRDQSTAPATPEDDLLVQTYKHLAGSSRVLQFLALLVLEVAQRSGGGAWKGLFGNRPTTSTAPRTAGDGVYRNQIKSQNFNASRSNVTESFRFNTSYLFMNILLSASHHVQCLTYGQSTVRKKRFGRHVRQGYLYNIIAGAYGIRGAGNGLFHDRPTAAGGGGLADTFVNVFTQRSASRGFFFGSRRSFGKRQSSAATADAILENLRHFYKDQLQSLAFHLRDRDDPDEFFYHLARRNFWDMYAHRLRLVHGPFYKDVIRTVHHDSFLRRLFYAQLKRAVLPEYAGQGLQAVGDGRNPTQVTLPPGLAQRRIPTYYTDDPEFSAIITDAHRSILLLKGLAFAPTRTRYIYTLNLLNQFGDDLQTTSLLNLATARDKTPTDEMLENVQNEDALDLEKRLAALMKRYKIQDKLFLVELQRNNTRLLFHFLHFVENNGALDTLGNLNVTYGNIYDLHTLLHDALRIDDKRSGTFQPQRTFFSSVFFRGKGREAMAERLFSMEPYLTLDTRLVQKLARSDGFRTMLHNWSLHKNLFWRIVDFAPSNALPYAFSLYVFLPSHIYLTREVRNILPALEAQSRATMDAIVGAQEAFDDKDVRKVFQNGTGGEMDALVRGLLYKIKQDLLQTTETNVFVVRLGKRGSAPGMAGDNSRFWLFAQWHRQYVLYDLGGNVRLDAAGLHILRVDPATVDRKANRIPNLLDERIRESSDRMRKVVELWRRQVDVQAMQAGRTTVHEEAKTRRKLQQRRTSMTRKMANYKAINGPDALKDYESPSDIGSSVVAQHERVYNFIRILQQLALHKQLLHKRGGPASQRLGNTKPYQDNPMCAVMWLVFRDLYTFLPGMYNHVMMAVNERLRFCEMGLALSNGGILPGGPLVPRESAFALTEHGYEYYVGGEVDTGRETNGSPRYADDRHYLLRLHGTVHRSGPASIDRRLMFQMLLQNMAQLGAVQDAAFSRNDSEAADVEVMSWMQYVADKEVIDRLTDNKHRTLMFSVLLNGIFTCNAVLNNVGYLRTAANFLYPSGLVSATTGAVWALARSLTPLMFSAGWMAISSSFAHGFALSSFSGGFAGLYEKVKSAGSTLMEGVTEGNISGAFAKIFHSTKDAATDATKATVKTLGDKVRDTLTEYLVTNVLMYRVKTYFVFEGNAYEWRFDIGVDRETRMVLMYHGIPKGDTKNQKVTAFRDIDMLGKAPNAVVTRVRQHKDRLTARGSGFGAVRGAKHTRSASYDARSPHTRRKRRQMLRGMQRGGTQQMRQGRPRGRRRVGRGKRARATMKGREPR